MLFFCGYSHPDLNKIPIRGNLESRTPHFMSVAICCFLEKINQGDFYSALTLGCRFKSGNIDVITQAEVKTSIVETNIRDQGI
jgi:hypothetical protein